jgi:kynurenine formamidase
MWNIVDLTLTIRDQWRWPVKLETVSTHEKDGFLERYMRFRPHSFTHVDAPLHYLPHGASIDKMPLDAFYGEAAIINLSHLGESTGVSAAELEKHGQHVRRNDIALIRTDWPLKSDYMTKDFWAKAPYMERDACEWLVQRKVKAWGGDFPCDFCLRYEVTDRARLATLKPEDHTTHHVFFKAGVIQFEYIVNQHLLKRNRVNFMALPLPIEGLDGSPVRAIAFEEPIGREL